MSAVKTLHESFSQKLTFYHLNYWALNLIYVGSVDLHQFIKKRRYKSCCMLKYTTFTHLPNTFQHPQYVPFFSSRVDWLLSYYIVNLIILPSIHVLPCHAVYFYYYLYYYYYISILQCHLLLLPCQRFCGHQ